MTNLGLSGYDLPQGLLIEDFAVNMPFLENKMGEITARAYLLSVVEIVNNVQQIGTSGLPIVTNYILGLICRSDSTYLFDLHRKDENCYASGSGTAVLKFDTLHSLKIYIRSVYYNAYPLTLQFQK